VGLLRAPGPKAVSTHITNSPLGYGTPNKLRRLGCASASQFPGPSTLSLHLCGPHMHFVHLARCTELRYCIAENLIKTDMHEACWVFWGMLGLLRHMWRVVCECSGCKRVTCACCCACWL
jgi:hypothetical protein